MEGPHTLQPWTLARILLKKPEELVGPWHVSLKWSLPTRAITALVGEKKQKDCLLEDEAWRPVCDPGWALAGALGLPVGCGHSACQDPRQHVLLPHPLWVGRREVPAHPSPLLIEGKWDPENCRGV